MPLPEYFEFQDRTKMIFGEKTIDQVGDEAALLGGTKALIVTDAVVGKLGFVERITKSLKSAGIEAVMVFDEVPVDSDAAVVQKVYAEASEKGADITIAIGGGSVIDTAKGINILLTEGGDLMNDYQGAYLLQNPLKPFIVVPTTAGTGSEVTFAAVIKDRAQHLKISFISPFMAPNVAILDPEVTRKMPKGLTASTGMDALTHAIESMHSMTSEPVADALAFGAIRMIAKWLPKSVADGNDLEARGRMLIASSIAGLAFTNALVGIVHGIAHSLGGVCNVPHGVANSILLPWCMEWNLDYCTEQYAEVAHAMGIADSGDARADAVAGIAAVRKLTRDIGMPQTLRDVGVKEEDLPAVSETTLGDGSVVTNPRPVEDASEVLEILKRVF